MADLLTLFGRSLHRGSSVLNNRTTQLTCTSIFVKILQLLFDGISPPTAPPFPPEKRIPSLLIGMDDDIPIT